MFTKHIARTHFNLTTRRFILFPDEAGKVQVAFELWSHKILFHSFIHSINTQNCTMRVRWGMRDTVVNAIQFHPQASHSMVVWAHYALLCGPGQVTELF